MNLRLLGRAVSLVLFLLPLTVCALTPVPKGLPANKTAAFKLRFAHLTQVKEALNQRIEQFDQACDSVAQGSAQAAACARDQADIRSQKDAYLAQARAYDKDLTVAIDDELQVINNRIPKTRKELENLSSQLLGFQDSVDEWFKLSDDARERARHTVKEAVVTLLLEKLSVAKEEEIKLDEGALSKINVLLRKRVFMDDLYAQVLTVNNLRSLRTDLSVIKLLQRVQAAMVMHTAWESGDREETLRALLKGIEIVCQDPKVTLLIVDGELAIDAASGWLAHKYAKERVDQLLGLGEARFKSVQTLTNLYKTDIDNRKTLIAGRPL